MKNQILLTTNSLKKLNSLKANQISLILIFLESNCKDDYSQLDDVSILTLEFLKQEEQIFEIKRKSILTLFDYEKSEKQSDIPTLEEFKEYALYKAGNKKLDIWKLELKYQAWVENEWKDGKDKAIKNWKSKLLQTIPFLLERVTNRKKAATYNRHDAIRRSR